MNLCAMPRIKQIIECLKAQNTSWEKTTKKRIKNQTKNFYASACVQIAIGLYLLYVLLC